MREAYAAGFPEARFRVWNRSPGGAKALAAAFPGTEVADDLEPAVRGADIITSATMATRPFIRGDWLRPGQHLDLIGAFRPDMREADDEVLRRGRVFVDSRDTVLGHIGELRDPIARGVIRPRRRGGGFLPARRLHPHAEDDITVFKNGGGAHLDLMTARYILGA